MTIDLANLITAPGAAADAGYRVTASAVSIAATTVLALGQWSSPPAARAALPLPDELAPILAWVPAVASWADAHATLTGVVGFALVLLGPTAAD